MVRDRSYGLWQLGSEDDNRTQVLNDKTLEPCVGVARCAVNIVHNSSARSATSDEQSTVPIKLASAGKQSMNLSAS